MVLLKAESAISFLKLSDKKVPNVNFNLCEKQRTLNKKIIDIIFLLHLKQSYDAFEQLYIFR